MSGPKAIVQAPLGRRGKIAKVIVILAVLGLLSLALYAGWSWYRGAKRAHDRRTAVAALEMAARVVLEQRGDCPRDWPSVWRRIGYRDDGASYFPDPLPDGVVDWGAFCDAIEKARLQGASGISVGETVVPLQTR
jgi:hypothetical protein